MRRGMGTNSQLPKAPRAAEQGLYLPKVPRPRGPCYGFSPRRCHGCPDLGLRPVRRDSSHAVYWCGTYSTPCDLFLRSMSMDRLVAMEAFVFVVHSGLLSAAER